MPKLISTSNFSPTSQKRFDKFVESRNWTWAGLCVALVKKFGVEPLKDFHEMLGTTIKELDK